MIDLRDAIDAVKAHLADGSVRALTYAALECRLAIEHICYDRLARAHDYISQEEVRRWQPHHVIRLLKEDVDPHVASTYTISIGRQPLSGNEDLTKIDYVPIGTQQGFDGSVLAKLWNGLSHTALHVALPRSSGVQVARFGDAGEIRAKVEQALVEIERIATGNLTSTGVGPEVSFTCNCGTRVKRRAEQLSPGKVVYCINPKCSESFEVELDGGDINFVLRKVPATCTCGEVHEIPMAPLEKLRTGETANAQCGCGAEIVFRWRLFYGIRKPASAENTAE